MRIPALTSLALILASQPALADDLVWSNITNFPADLETTGDGWSAIRVEAPDFISFRCAADDIIITEATELTTLRYYSAYAREIPEIIAADVYIYAVSSSDQPGALIAALPNLAIANSDSGIVNALFGTVYLNEVDLDGLLLTPGRYFFAFRTVQAWNGSEGRNAPLTTRVRLGQSTGQWSFDVPTDGAGGSWTPLTTFNLEPNNEWAFQLFGNTPSCPADFDGDGFVTGLDFDAFVAAFEAGDPSSDFDGDGFITGLDFDAFVTAFEAGCD